MKNKYKKMKRKEKPMPQIVVEGDMVMEKNVQHEVNGVSAGGVGIEIGSTNNNPFTGMEIW